MKKIIFLVGVVLTTILTLTACSNETDSIKATETPFPTVEGVELYGGKINNEVFADYDATIVNFWNNGCGTCIEEMPELEAYYQEFKELDINMLGVASDSGESQEKLEFAKKIIEEKGVTYKNISPSVDSDFYLEFINALTGYPTTYVVDSSGNIIGTPIIGNVKNQDDQLMNRIHYILGELEKKS